MKTEPTTPLPAGAAAPSVAHDYGAACGPATVAKARAIDLRQPEAHDFFGDLFDASSANGEKCAIELVHLLSGRIDSATDSSLRSRYYNAVATFARFLSRETVAAVKEAYLRIGYDGENSRSYFLGLRSTLIDIREPLRLKVGKDEWTSFTGPGASSTENATTWYYYLYLASLETPGALDAIGRKLTATRSGNDVYNLLMSLAELKTSPAKSSVRRVLVSFANDERRVDASTGPGSKLSELIPIQLQYFGE